MSQLNRMWWMLVLTMSVNCAYGLDSSGWSSKASYKEVKTAHEAFSMTKPSKAARLENMREIINSGQLGRTGQERLYHNFKGLYSIDPTIPGVETTTLLTRSSSQAQAKGYRRELLYAVAIHNDPRFKLEAMNRPLSRAWGKTDADIIFRNRSTGQFGRIEVKDYSINSQVTNFKKLKIQLDKMARELNYSGQPQIWMNRRGVHPAIHKYATDRGILVLGNVSTGGALRGNAISSSEALDRINQESVKLDRSRAINAGAAFASGVLLLLNAPTALTDLNEAMSSGSHQAWLNFAGSGMQTATGLALVTHQTTYALSRLTSIETQGVLFRAGRVAGRFGVVGLGVDQGISLVRFVRGDISGTTLLVASAPQIAGASVRVLFLFLPSIATISAVPGAILVPVVLVFAPGVVEVVDSWWREAKDADLNRRFGEFVYGCYGIGGGSGACLRQSAYSVHLQ